MGREHTLLPATAASGWPDNPPAALTLLMALRRHGVQHLFCNPGTDFPAIVEAYSLVAQHPALTDQLPTPIVVPHENAAVAMAHGAYLVSGQPQAVMVHVNVGTANTINGIANAARDQAPILVMAGRTPISETGRLGSRSRHIHWAQEMYDQAGMVRELCKWDQELKMSSETEVTVARAMEMMLSSPPGPAYLSLPREVLSEPLALQDTPRAPKAVASAPWPNPADIATLAGWIAEAERPLVISATSGRTAAGFDAVAQIAERCALPVVTMGGRYASLPTSHSMHFGYQPKALLAQADLVIVLECDVPWIPSLESPPAGCRVVHISEDPAFAGYPTRGFPVDLAIDASAAVALPLLQAALLAQGAAGADRVATRRTWLAARRSAQREAWHEAELAASRNKDIKPEWISRCLSDALHAAVGDAAIMVNEYPLRQEHCDFERHGSFLGQSPAGGLGWGLGAALGVKLRQPDRLVAVTLGDGAYMFDNPTACHWVSQVQKLPVLVVIFNNQMYGAVRNSTAAMYRDGASGNNACTLLADLSPAPAFELVAQASGGYGERVDDPAELPAALARALHEVQVVGRQALLNVICRY
jgi:acetolactate synthase-1/2/3 large subunit